MPGSSNSILAFCGFGRALALGLVGLRRPRFSVERTSAGTARAVTSSARSTRAWAARPGGWQPVRAGRPVRLEAQEEGRLRHRGGGERLLWRASLDTINFIPLVSADPFGGVIITDWYTPAETPNERMKVQVTILDRELRADGVRVSVFKQQTAPKGGNWVDAQVDPRTNIDIENAILTRARQLRIAGGS